MNVHSVLSRALPALLLTILLVGAPTLPRAAESGNRLNLLSILPGGTAKALLFPVVETTDDTGLDGQAGTDDEGENDGYPDPGETLGKLSSDTIVVKVQNEPRLGTLGEVTKGRPLFVDSAVITYHICAGPNAGRTPAYAPPLSFRPAVSVAPEATADITLVAVPYSPMKVPAQVTVRGLRDIFLFPVDPQELQDAQVLCGTLDVWARDLENDTSEHAQAQFNVGFYNPNVGGAPPSSSGSSSGSGT